MTMRVLNGSLGFEDILTALSTLRVDMLDYSLHSVLVAPGGMKDDWKTPVAPTTIVFEDSLYQADFVAWETKEYSGSPECDGFEHFAGCGCGSERVTTRMLVVGEDVSFAITSVYSIGPHFDSERWVELEVVEDTEAWLEEHAPPEQKEEILSTLYTMA